MRKLAPIFLLTLYLSACTTPIQPPTETITPAPSVSIPPSQSTTPNPNSPSQTNSPTEKPIEIKATATPKPSPSVKGASTNVQSGNNTTNISVNSNNTSVKIINKNGKRYAELNGKEVELDADGCYRYDDGSTKIQSCVN